ncbi:hypothetical protein KKC88_04200 [Patescibacteria group bacterium]|nr:hypothetical protein [Patescibacteria group bacterium]MBU1673803.1 hypothetical protein [Patescibacteria group bacterium]MBU1963775.1 hypothetical protein [Patescibacteria group bacterium]
MNEKNGLRLLVLLGFLALVVLFVWGWSRILKPLYDQAPETTFVPAPEIEMAWCAEFAVTTSEMFWVDALYEPAENMEFNVSSDMGFIWCVLGAADLEVLPKNGSELGLLSEGAMTSLCQPGDFEKVAAVFGTECGVPEGVIYGGPDEDDDGDGYSERQGDCDDTTPTIYPGHGCP